MRAANLASSAVTILVRVVLLAWMQIGDSRQLPRRDRRDDARHHTPRWTSRWRGCARHQFAPALFGR